MQIHGGSYFLQQPGFLRFCLCRFSSLTQGIGQTTQSNLFTCPGGRVTNMGKITSTDNKTWILPGENEFSTGTRLFDLYNECAKITPGSLNQIDTSKAPVIEIDADGEIISGFYMVITIMNCM